MKATKEQITSIIKEVLDNESMLDYKKEWGAYEYEFCASRGDELSNEQTIEVVNDEYPQNKIYEILSDSWSDYKDEISDEIVNNIINELDDKDIEYDAYKINEEVEELIYFEYPYDHFYKQELLVNICMYNDNESNCENTFNNFGNGYYREYYNDTDINDDSSILKLSQLQGYTKKDLENMLKGKIKNNSKFLKSTMQELESITSQINHVVFFKKMTLKELLAIKGKNINADDTEVKDITIGTNINCGLVDFSNGAGGVLEIELEKEITLKAHEYEIHIDGDNGYGIKEIFGLYGSHWKE